MNPNEIDEKALQDEAQLTAFALNELNGEEKEATAKRVAADPAAQAFVAATRATAQQLEGELKKEMRATEPVVVRATRRMAPTEAAGASRRPKRLWLFAVGSAAAVLLVCVMLMSTAKESARRAAQTCSPAVKSELGASQNVIQDEQVALNIETPSPAFIGTPKAPPSDVKLDPRARGVAAPTGPVVVHGEQEKGKIELSSSPMAGLNAAEVAATPPLSRVLPVVPGKPFTSTLSIQTKDNSATFLRPQDDEVGPGHDNNNFDRIVDNDFQRVSEKPLSTFSIDVDTGSYSLIRSFLMQQNRMPPPDSVRIEEMINYFDYPYEPPTDGTPFATRVEIAPCPWQPQHRLAKIGLKGREIAAAARPLSNLVFLLDVSGSMRASNKLPLVQQGLSLLVQQLNEGDYVSIVVYAGAAGTVLPPTSGDQKKVILDAMNRLSAGGSTNGGRGIQLAYALARQHFVQSGTNRVILCSDGDFNVGTTSRGDLIQLIEKEAKSGVFLSIFGFGMGNYKDGTMEQLADKGNGNYGYIDTIAEAKKLFVDQMSGTLVTIAKDVKIQVEFNPFVVAGYRLIGYENRMLKKEDFNDDTKDAGEIGAGHTVTALYEIVPAGQSVPAAPGVDPLKYQMPAQPTSEASNGEMMTVKLRYKQPDGEVSKLLEFPITDEGLTQGKSTPDFRFAAAVAAFGMILRDSPYCGVATLDFVQELASEGVGSDRNGYRAEFVKLVEKAKTLKPQRQP